MLHSHGRGTCRDPVPPSARVLAHEPNTFQLSRKTWAITALVSPSGQQINITDDPTAHENWRLLQKRCMISLRPAAITPCSPGRWTEQTWLRELRNRGEPLIHSHDTAVATRYSTPQTTNQRTVKVRHIHVSRTARTESVVHRSLSSRLTHPPILPSI